MRLYYTILYLGLSLQFIDGQVILNTTPTRAVGAARLEQVGSITNVQPNLVEGHELNNPQAVALDLTVNPPHLYVADTLNNRILGWKDATSFSNGAFADIVIGQNDFFTTTPQGPGITGSTLQNTGLSAPMGMAVDSNGSLYVIDAGNNRILRFPKPFSQSGTATPNMVIGQQSFTGFQANSGGVSASTVSFSNGSGTFQAYLKFDSAGNLWVADVLNQRVLEYKASDLAKGNNGPAAAIVLGQPDFVTTKQITPYDPTSTTSLNYPTGIAFDQSEGRLYVSESQPTTTPAGVASRILIFQPPFSNSKPAQRIIGTVSANAGPLTMVNGQQLSSGATDLFNINDNIGIADTNNHRILVFPTYSQFTPDTLTQNALAVFGQGDFNSGMPNRGRNDANSNSVAAPVDVAYAPGTLSPFPDTSGEIYIADAGNNRVIVVPVTPNSSTFGFNTAVRLLGQQQFSERAPNFIEGREFNFAPGASTDAGIAVDNSSNPPHLYVADTYNNRILCFADYRTVKTGSAATFAIGQPDLFRSIVNYPSGSPTMRGAQGLLHPTGLAVDQATGNLYVADTGNGRVLRFPAPFKQPNNVVQTADLVLGQANFTTTETVVTASRLGAPYGLALVPGIGLLVSDALFNRVVLFPGSLQTGMAATTVWGQINSTSKVAGIADNRFNQPHGIAVDSKQRLYVADTGNNRVLVFDNIQQTKANAHALLSITALATAAGGALQAPRAVLVTSASPADPGDPADEIWIGDSSRGLRFAGGFDSLETSNFTPDLVIPESGALAMVLDQFGALYVADATNRMVIHYAGLAALNGASFNTVRTTAAPNTILSVFPRGGQFSKDTQSFSTLPLPTSMLGVQVQLNGTPLPLYYVSPTQINLLLPNNVPTSGTADLQVIRMDNGQVLGDTSVVMSTAAPGIFTATGSGKGQAAALNQDGSPNNSSNPVARGDVLQVYGTGVGFISGAPNDGTAVSGPTPSPQTTIAYIGGVKCPVQYSGMAPGLVGVWQINVQVSQDVDPTKSLPDRTSELLIIESGAPSGGLSLYGFQVLVWVK